MLQLKFQRLRFPFDDLRSGQRGRSALLIVCDHACSTVGQLAIADGTAWTLRGGATSPI
jgi:hypothetical protein